MQYDEPSVRREGHRVYVRDYPGSEPAIILMHGFPDNLHLYDRVVPLLDNGRRVVTFDFLGWGRSDKPAGYAYTASNQTGDLDAVIEHLQLGSVVLVAHDASGLPVPAERAGPPWPGPPLPRERARRGRMWSLRECDYTDRGRRRRKEVMLTRPTNRETGAGGGSTETDFTARRITYDSDYGYQETRARFDEQVPLLDGAVAVELVVSRAPWSAVQAAVNDRVGPTGFVAMARIDQGALLSLSGEALDGTLYLVGNPIVASDVTSGDPAAVLYVPFRVAVYRDTSGVHLSYDHPSSVLGSLDSAGINEIATELDRKIQLTAEASCR